MSEFLIDGGVRLEGNIGVQTSKNALLPIICGALLVEGEVVLKNVAPYLDVENLLDIVKRCDVKIEHEFGAVVLDASSAKPSLIPSALSKQLRASILLLGAFVGRFRHARVTFPGGCEIGLRPIDLHLNALRELGVIIEENHGIINCDASNLRGGVVMLDFASVGATENIILASVLGAEEVTILNAAREPEIVDLSNFLNRCGANIVGAGTNEIVIKPVKKLFPIEYEPIKDRIVGCTYLLAGAITHGNIEVRGVKYAQNISFLKKLCQSGCQLNIKSDTITLKSPKTFQTVDMIETNVYPAFPTDLQSPFVALLSIIKGVCIVRENVFESRFKYVPELIKMGAKIKVKNNVALIEGVEKLSGAEVWATDLRGGAGLILAALCANGYTTIHNANHILRGYSNLAENLGSLGARIKYK